MMETTTTADSSGGGSGADPSVTVQLVDETGAVLSESAPALPNQYRMAKGTVTAPSTPGSYYLVGTCDGKQGYPEPYEVFAPATLAAGAPLPAEPSSGWPSTGARETYHGRIGPISLPAMQMDESEMGQMVNQDMVGKTSDSGTRANGSSAPATTVPGNRRDGLGPTGIFIDVPRPSGDFAITKLSFNLVDDQGNPVAQDQAHLHHFVIANASGENPACPDSTFGIPGQIVGAAGAERTVLSTGDPYGLVVKGNDDWKGVYELMSRAHQDQQVFLTYDIDLRRDVENVRPLTTYFGSATGCSTFNWPIDGSGTPDVQSTYVTIAKDGLMLGAGGHIHNGGSYADLSDDRNRRLCRSELTFGNDSVGMGDLMNNPYQPPEFCDDDRTIAAISNCSLRETVKAGERLRFDAAYDNERARTGVMGIYTFYVWEGGGPAAPAVSGAGRTPVAPTAPVAGAAGATPVSGRPSYTG